MLSFETLLVVSICLVSILTANPIHGVQELDSLPATLFQTLHRQESSFSGSSTNEKLCSPSDQFREPHRRAHGSYIWRARPYELLSPFRRAASVLRDSYYPDLLRVNKRWWFRGPFPSLWIRQGNLELPHCSVGGAATCSVLAFTHEMLGHYDTTHQNATANEEILRIASNQLSLSQAHLIKPRTVGEGKGTELNKRVSMRPISIRIHEVIVPVSLAAPHLKRFFDDIVTEALSSWKSRPEANLLTVTQGCLQLTVSSLGGKITWLGLASAAVHFSDRVSHFWSNTFDAYYEDLDSGFRLAFSLRILQVPADQSVMALSVPSEGRTRKRRKGRRKTTTTLHPRTLPAPPPHSTPSPSSSPLQSRTPPPSSLHFNFVRTAVIVPVAIAAQQLEDFYTIIAFKVETGQMAHRPPSRTISLSLWDFELVFSSERTPVPWSFVQAFAIEMAAYSARSWTGFYEATVRGGGALSGLTIFVQMRLKASAMGIVQTGN